VAQIIINLDGETAREAKALFKWKRVQLAEEPQQEEFDDDGVLIPPADPPTINQVGEAELSAVFGDYLQRQTRKMKQEKSKAFKPELEVDYVE